MAPTDIPPRLSVKDIDTQMYPWEWARRLVFAVNGIPRDKVVSYDIPARTLTRLATDEQGNPYAEHGEVKTETLTGDITVYFKD